MNRKLTTWLAMAVLSTGLALAQRPMHGGGGGNRLDSLAVRLSLTDAQVAQAVTIFNNADVAAAPIRTNLATARTALSTAVTNGSTAAQIDQLAANYGTLSGQLIALETRASASFYALLTAEQRAIYNALRGRGRFGAGERRPE